MESGLKSNTNTRENKDFCKVCVMFQSLSAPLNWYDDFDFKIQTTGCVISPLVLCMGDF